jgi:hypothetical protein
MPVIPNKHGKLVRDGHLSGVIKEQDASEKNFFNDALKQSLPLLQNVVGKISPLDAKDPPDKKEGIIQIVDPGINGGKISNIPSVFDGKKVSPKLAIHVAKEMQRQGLKKYPEFKNRKDAKDAANLRESLLMVLRSANKEEFSERHAALIKDGTIPPDPIVSGNTQ